MPNNPSYFDMPLWQRAVHTAAEISSLASRLPNSDNLIVTDTIQEAALSIPTLIARSSRASKKTFLEGCLLARQTITEIETYLTVIQQIYGDLPVDGALQSISELDTALLQTARQLSSNRPLGPEKRHAIN